MKPKRTALTLDPATDAALSKLARLQRRPKATVAADLLSEMTPSLVRIADLLELATRKRVTLPAETAARLAGIEELLTHSAAFSLDRLATAVESQTGTQKGARSAPRRPRKPN